MIIYCTFIRSRSRAFMMLTVVGRFRHSPPPRRSCRLQCLFLPLPLPPRLTSASKHHPYASLVCARQRGPPHASVSPPPPPLPEPLFFYTDTRGSFGCALDLVFASWTLIALLRQGGEAIIDFPMPSTIRELAARICMCAAHAVLLTTLTPPSLSLPSPSCACGMAELFSGALILADQTMQVHLPHIGCACLFCVTLPLPPTRASQSDVGAAWAPVAQLQPAPQDLQLGLCRFARSNS
jgi:hypothetical protein